MSASDRRLTLVRDGIADRRLEGLVPAERFADVTPMQVSAPIASLRKAPEPDAEQEDQLVFGELFDVLFEAGDFAFGQARRDRYVGYVLLEALSAPVLPPDCRIAAPRTYAFAEPDIKSAIVGLYSLNALVTVEAREGRFVKGARAGWFVDHHLAPIGRFETDHVAVAERFLHAPYQWGGRESLGLDCSALVQQALYACGRACPRDTDLQRDFFPEIAEAERRRGDLVFWKGHVAILLDPDTILHANAHHMATAIEPLAKAIARIAATPTGGVLGYRRV
ncbi:peptidoglycan endopeptidase [Caulobacter vibrioides]|uniref:C40 family peptidase n=1 Tax=Caulobacter vibrioides TaxID=155892 RepID=UPI000BB50025|nr:NlpC/P60 family protein [Caulobacter vibrioides]ATC25831.1 peptidoglycan endopeptidase [Caulobacter vibrioides]AZH13974.1 peptidoglycan endopeptidase [Caulobacter vibrioides]PLR16529.1 peptidoglycan endopeptidase [Caulobacter vibrioides]